jgi:sigma-54 dependent transcriptional regulator, acetoin dehydrogenase operon transcriptional activator AcoR
VLTGLRATLANEPVSLMLTDSEGLVLNRLSGDTSLLRALDAVHLAPGFAFPEREAGTNGPGRRSPTGCPRWCGPRSTTAPTDAARLEPGLGALPSLCTAWTEALRDAERALAAGEVVAAVGEAGAGRSTLLALAQRRVRPRDRILSARPPASGDLEDEPGHDLPEGRAVRDPAS